MPSSVESVASFSVILAETFAAVGLATIVPTAVIATAKLSKAAINTAVSQATPTQVDNSKATALADKTNTPGSDPVDSVVFKGLKVIQAAVANVKDINLLMPDKAHIHSEFTFSANDSMSEDMGIGVNIQAVSIKAGFSALFTSKSTNKITLDIDFAPVAVNL